MWTYRTYNSVREIVSTRMYHNFFNIDPFLMIFAPFESSRSQLSNGAKIIKTDRYGKSHKLSWAKRQVALPFCRFAVLPKIHIGIRGDFQRCYIYPFMSPKCKTNGENRLSSSRYVDWRKKKPKIFRNEKLDFSWSGPKFRISPDFSGCQNPNWQNGKTAKRQICN